MKTNTDIKTTTRLFIASTKRLLGILTMCFTTFTVALAAPQEALNPDQIEDKLRVALGTEVSARFKADGNQRLKFKSDVEPGARGTLITAALRQTDSTPTAVKGDPTRPYLVVSNGFNKPLKFRVLARDKGSNKFVEVLDIEQPVEPGKNQIVICFMSGSLLEEVILHQLTLSDKTR